VIFFVVVGRYKMLKADLLLLLDLLLQLLATARAVDLQEDNARGKP
jgi:hypothetical protein